MADLLDSYKLNGKKVKNRLVFPPVVSQSIRREGIVTARHIEHYERIAKGGTGLIIAEACCVSRNGRLGAGQLGIWDDAFIEGLREISRTIHQYGAVCLLQIHHAGFRSIKSDNGEPPISASDYEDGIYVAREMTQDDIHVTTQDFVNAAVRAQKAGFDGVEIHACHGYLINQFISPLSNTRRDVYGAHRYKFGCDIVAAIRRVVGHSFIVGARLACNDPDLAASINYATHFESSGVNIFHFSVGLERDCPHDLHYTENDDYSFIVAAGAEIKKHVKVPVIVVNGVRRPEQAQFIVSKGMADFVAAARGLIADSAWINKMQSGEPIAPCTHCGLCSKMTDINICPIRKK